MSGPVRLAFDGLRPGPRPSHCAGALIIVDRDRYRDFERNGVLWKTPITEIPADGKAGAHVSCTSEEMAIDRRHGRYTYGLCSSCAAMEARMREELRARQERR